MIRVGYDSFAEEPRMLAQLREAIEQTTAR